MNLKSGDIVINKANGRKYVIDEKLPDGNYSMRSMRTDRTYTLTDFNKYIVDTTGCLHSWRTYNSGWIIYDYCVHCDMKREHT